MSELVSKRGAKHLQQFSREVELSFSNRVKEIILFGSRARGDATKLSDYNVAVVLGDNDLKRVDNHALADLAGPHILAGVHIRPVLLGRDLYNEQVDPVVMNIKMDAVAISKS